MTEGRDTPHQLPILHDLPFSTSLALLPFPPEVRRSASFCHHSIVLSFLSPPLPSSRFLLLPLLSSPHFPSKPPIHTT